MEETFELEIKILCNVLQLYEEAYKGMNELRLYAQSVYRIQCSFLFMLNLNMLILHSRSVLRDARHSSPRRCSGSALDK